MTDVDYGDEIVTLVEIDQPLCTLTYGTNPCTAALGTTGERKCFNTRRTCQDPENYAPATFTLRFGQNQSGVAKFYAPLIPSVDRVSISPLQINIGGMDESLSPFGRRETASIVLNDHQHSDLLVDPYRLERISGAAQNSGEGYDPYERGTFWGKWIARNPFNEGYALRVYQGKMGQPIEEMRVRNYVIDKIQGPDDGRVRIDAKDLFSLVENRKAKAPKASRGELQAALTETDTSATLVPAGVGNEDYDAAGWVAIGDEIMAFTRNGDTLSLTERGALNTEPEEHEAEDAVQLVLAYESETIPDIVEDLLTTYARVPASFIPKADWDAEANENIDRLYTAYIAEPTEVETLVGELTEQAGFTIWPEVDTNTIRLKALIPPVLGDLSQTVNDRDWIRAGSLEVKRRPEQRTSQVWVYYGLLNPLEGVDDATNYAARAIRADLESEGDEQYGTASVREVWGRWIPRFGRAVAQQAGNRILSIFRDPPIRSHFDLYAGRDGELSLASPFRLHTDEVQDEIGESLPTPSVPIQLFRDADKVQVRAQELRFFMPTDEERRIFIDVDDLNINLRALHDQLYGEPEPGDDVICDIANGVVIGSNSVSDYAFVVGDWPEGINIEITNRGVISGTAGSAGGGGNASATGGFDFSQDSSPGESGGNGGDSLFTNHPVTIDNLGTIQGGGGGGGGGGGAARSNSELVTASAGAGAGAGAGFVLRSGASSGSASVSGGVDRDSCSGSNGQDGQLSDAGNGGIGCTSEASGGGQTITSASGDAGNGGDPGQPGQGGGSGSTSGPGSGDTSSGGSGGSAGTAVNGDSLITWTNEGTILGNRTG